MSDEEMKCSYCGQKLNDEIVKGDFGTYCSRLCRRREEGIEDEDE